MIKQCIRRGRIAGQNSATAKEGNRDQEMAKQPALHSKQWQNALNGVALKCSQIKSFVVKGVFNYVLPIPTMVIRCSRHRRHVGIPFRWVPAGLNPHLFGISPLSWLRRLCAPEDMPYREQQLATAFRYPYNFETSSIRSPSAVALFFALWTPGCSSF